MNVHLLNDQRTLARIHTEGSMFPMGFLCPQMQYLVELTRTDPQYLSNLIFDRSRRPFAVPRDSTFPPVSLVLSPETAFFP